MSWPNLAHYVVLLWFLSSQTALSWGERGHDIITQIACKILQEKYKGLQELTQPFVLRCEMLGHLSNIPDIYWRSLPKKATKGADSSHYIDLDYAQPNPSLKNFSTNIVQNFLSARKSCEVIEKKDGCKSLAADEMMDKIGTAPWRTNQLASLLKAKFSEISQIEHHFNEKKGAFPKNQLENLVNQALVYAGLLSHFVGDLAQPLHTTKNYDGIETGQGGGHAFFESMVLGSYDFSLEQEAYEYALKNKPNEKLIHSLLNEIGTQGDAWQPLNWIIAFSLESFALVDEVLAIDKKFALRKPSQTTPHKRLGERAPPEDLRGPYRSLLVERLASGADMLAFFWYQAWAQGGKPNMKDFSSYKYMFMPDFIEINYIPKNITGKKRK